MLAGTATSKNNAAAESKRMAHQRGRERACGEQGEGRHFELLTDQKLLRKSSRKSQCSFGEPGKAQCEAVKTDSTWSDQREDSMDIKMHVTKKSAVQGLCKDCVLLDFIELI